MTLSLLAMTNSLSSADSDNIANILDPDQDQQNVGCDPDPNVQEIIF